MTAGGADVCVVGGGPAGSVLARRLAGLGRHVVLFDSGAAVAAPAEHHLPPSSADLLASLGAADALARAVYAPVEARLVAWGGAAEHHVDPRPGHLVDRQLLDAGLRDAAAAAGVRVHRPATVDRIERSGDGWVVAARTSNGVVQVGATVVVEAGGARSGLGRAAARTAPPTSALFGTWRSRHADVVRVEALAEGWLWGAPRRGGGTVVALFVDRSAMAGRTAAGRLAAYCSVIAASTLFRDLGGPPSGDGLRVADATARLHPTPAAAGRVRVGAAAVAPDPLSSQGLQGAVRSGVQGAAVVETMLREGRDAPHAVTFHNDATRRAATAHARFARREHGRAASMWPTSFWARRAGGEVAATTDGPAQMPAPPPGDVPLRWSEDARWHPTPVLAGPVVVIRPALHHPALDGPIAFAGDIEVGALRHAVPSGFDVVAARFGPVAGAALRELCQRGVLVADARPRNSPDSAARRAAS